MAQPIDADLTHGPISTHFKALAIPAALGMLFSTLYNIVDMYFAGWLDTSAQAGLALGFQVFLIALSFALGLAAAMGSLVGNALGASDKRRARRVAAQGISFGLSAAIVLGLLGAWLGPFAIVAVSLEGPYQDAGVRYFLILLFTLPAFFTALACNGILQAHGDGQSMTRGLAVAFVANIVLNPLFIYGVPGIFSGLGFDGLAVSTVVSQAGVMLYVLRQVFRLKTMTRMRRQNFIPKRTPFSQIAQMVLPVAVSLLVLNLSGIVLQFALKSFGEHAVAGFGVAIRLEQILLLPAQGVALALLPIAAQNFGAREFDRVREALFYCWKIGFIMTAIACPILWIFGRMMLGFFSDDPDVIRVGLAYLRIDSLILPLYMMMFAVNAFLQALKRPIWTVWISLYRQGFAIAFFVWIFIDPLGFDEVGVWLGVACAVTSGWVISILVARHVAIAELGRFWR